MSNGKRRGFSPVLAFILGFLLAFVITAGAVVTCVLVGLNYKLDKISANKDSEGNYIFINADVNNGGVGTVLDLVKKLTSMGKDFKSLSLGEVEEIIPAVGKLTDSLENTLEQFVSIEEGELEQVKFGELSDYMNNLMNRVDLVGLLDAPPDNAILAYFCLEVTSVSHDTENDRWTGKYKDEAGAVHDCEIVLDGNGNIKSGFYMDGGQKVELTPINLDNVSKRSKSVMSDLTLGEILKIDDSDKILSSVKNSTIESLADDFDKISVQQLFTEDVYALTEGEEGAQTKRDALFYQAVDGATPVSDPVYNADYIYYVKGDGGTFTLAGGYGKLKASEFSATDHYTLGAGKIMFDSAFVYYTENDGVYTMVDAGGTDAGRVYTPDGNTYYTYGAPTPLWKLLLSIEESDKVRREQVYSVNNITAMISNVTKNTQDTQMRELHAAGILVFEDPSELENSIVWYQNGAKHEKVIGDMPLLEVINVMLYISKNPTSLIPPGTLPSP